MSKKLLYSGIYECPDCEKEYQLERATQDEMICDQCDGELVETEEENDSDD